ncbi:MAG: RNase adapter RapZ [Capsulimonas sp.]|uniref:RNase adapter RapZ n=1 Tax=Capsulimonas sp. TaxID=2494211 RepID=UPI00326723E0
MELVVITGMSGAGKTVAARVFEDMSYNVVDNLPPVLLPELVEKCLAVKDQGMGGLLAVVIDARAGSFFMGWEPALKLIRRMGVEPKVLFLDAVDAALVQRFKETRRKHPIFDEQGGILGSIKLERTMLEPMKETANKVIDTSDLDTHYFRNLLLSAFAPQDDKNKGLTVTISSFGFKYGLPLDADLVFDVRFLVNPHYVDELRPCDGRDPKVEEFVMADPDCEPFLAKIYDLLDFCVPQYIEEGKAYLTVSIGCTGGRHRSVVVAEKLAAHLRGRDYRVLTQHRDVDK